MRRVFIVRWCLIWLIMGALCPLSRGQPPTHKVIVFHLARFEYAVDQPGNCDEPKNLFRKIGGVAKNTVTTPYRIIVNSDFSFTDDKCIDKSKIELRLTDAVAGEVRKKAATLDFEVDPREFDIVVEEVEHSPSERGTIHFIINPTLVQTGDNSFEIHFDVKRAHGNFQGPGSFGPFESKGAKGVMWRAPNGAAQVLAQLCEAVVSKEMPQQ